MTSDPPFVSGRADMVDVTPLLAYCQLTNFVEIPLCILLSHALSLTRLQSDIHIQCLIERKDTDDSFLEIALKTSVAKYSGSSISIIRL